MALIILGSLLGLTASQCNIATVTNEFTGSVSLSDIVSIWDSNVAYQIPAGSCFSLYVQGAIEYSGKWVCMTDSEGDYYMQYNIYSGTSTCSGNPIDNSDPTTWFTTIHAIATNPYYGGYVFKSSAQAQAVLATDAISTLAFVVQSYYTGDVQCGQANNCGASVSQSLYTNTTACAGDPIARTSIGNLVSGLCAVSVNVQLNLNIDCDLLTQMGYNATKYFGNLPGVCDSIIDASAPFSMGYVCKEDAIWLLGYNDDNCAGDYIGLRINEVCYSTPFGSYELDISCSNPNYAGSLNLVYSDGDAVVLDGPDGPNANNSNIYSIIYCIIFSIIFIILQ